MAKRWRQYSYADQQNYLRKIRIVSIWIFSFFIIHTLVSGLVVSNRAVENNTMRPGILPGERFVFLSFAVQHMFRTGNEGYLPFQRGQIVLVDRNTGKKPVFRTALDFTVRFFSLQRYSLFPKEDNLYVKRVIGLPGDTISMNNYVMRIKPASDTYEFTEFELSTLDYTPELPQLSLLWDESIPFSGFMDSIVLGKDECFVLSDDRSVTNDSRTWGPVPANTITARALVRYWPLTRLGHP
ncbi:MAG: signal peptidase I [Treponema sp.]|nr:signal peptidase I [Treponema sp.]